MVTTGFKFRNVSSKLYGIVCDPTTRMLLPEKRRTIVDIPGRSGVYMQTDGTYLVRSETFHCYFIKPENKTLAEAARDIAAWLSQDGRIEFDNEPNKYYDAYFTGAVPSTRHLHYGEFDLTFAYSPPFAYTETQQIIATVRSEADSVIVPVNGTADTPCRIIIVNNGSTTLNNIRVTRSTL